MSLKLKKLLKRFEEAAIAKSWIGNTEPESHKEIEEEYKKAKKDLNDFLEEIEKE